MKTITVDLGKNSYDILIDGGLLDRIGTHLSQIYQGKKVFIVTDENVNAYYAPAVERSLTASGFEVSKLVLPAGEKTKSIARITDIYQALLGFDMTRGQMLMALGGGVVGDIAGFCASTFMRGIPFVQVPTSLLAQVDSSVGRKVAVDLPEGKNLVGSFYQPKAVYIDPYVLDSLTHEFFYDGLGEVLKYALIADELLYQLLRTCITREDIMSQIETVIFRSCDLKRKIVERDERDTGDRMLLNFGHTIGHCIEQYYGYEKYSHGQAVVIGMSLMAQIGERMGISARGTAQKVDALLTAHGLEIRPEWPLKTYLGALKHDKKNIGNKLHLVVLDQICKARVILADEHFYRIAEEL